KLTLNNSVSPKLSFTTGTAKSTRIGPNGDLQETPVPIEARSEDLSTISLPLGSRLKRVPKSVKTRPATDRKSTRLNSSHVKSSYAVCCLQQHSTTAGARQH